MARELLDFVASFETFWWCVGCIGVALIVHGLDVAFDFRKKTGKARRLW